MGSLAGGAVDEPWPSMLEGLAPSERLIVWSFRHWLAGWAQQNGRAWSLVRNELSRELGPAHGRAALSALAQLVNGLHAGACRTICYHQPCCPCLGADEICVLKLVAACQNHEWRLACEAAASLVEAAAVGDLVSRATALAEAMRAQGVMPLRREAGGALRAGPAWRRALH